MARSDKVPFRREFKVTKNGFVGDSEGFFVGDILSLHIDVVNKQVNFFVQGKVGREGDWEIITSKDNVKSLPNIDIREYEYVRLQALNVIAETEIIIFGYEQNVLQSNLEATLSDRDFNTNIEIKCLLGEIKNELIKLNIHMSEITGDEI